MVYGCTQTIFFNVNTLAHFYVGLQRSLSNTEDECTHLKEMSERGQEELGELANKYNAAVNEIKELTDKIKVPA